MSGRTLLAVALAIGLAACEARNAPEVTSVKSEAKPSAGTKVATFGGGCFWCTEAMYRRLEGVISVESGFAGGATANPTYKQVCSGETGHAEVVQVVYDPAKVGYEDLLYVFFKTHDPTTPNRQGADVGTQYRSIVLYHDEAQRKVAEDLRARLDASGAFPGKIVTEIVPYDRFFKAEDYHQDYFASNPDVGYCRAVVGPKVEKFEKAFKDRLKK
jgi:peptide-methionine (S)-S-oxide reductase